MGDPNLALMKKALLWGLRVNLTPEQGDEAFERHQLLAIRFHRAARLNDRAGDREGQGWSRYFKEHFPRGDAHAELLWHKWRVPLLKDDTPGVGIAITHGQPQIHWEMTGAGLCVDLESMWDDFEQSVNAFVGSLERDAKRRKVALERWSARQWTVQPVVKTGVVVLQASAAGSATAIAPR
ncbi:MAG: hypothetical protein ACXWZ8_05035 [Gaiellaceae bacterium]